MNKWKNVVDKLLNEAIGNGDISHLPGAGKPLRLDNDSHTPADMRMAHKIMGDHDVIPEWISKSQELEKVESDLHKLARRGARQYQQKRQASQKPGRIDTKSRVDGDWERFKEKFNERVEHYNRGVLNHNLSVPPGIAHKSLLKSEQMLRRALQASASESKAKA